jgi:3'-phosphoadenosine 5'-phosphosulfate synthase
MAKFAYAPLSIVRIGFVSSARSSPCFVPFVFVTEQYNSHLSHCFECIICIVPNKQEESNRRSARSNVTSSGNDTNRNTSQGDDDKLVQERMPFCIGICVLLAIVYVLSRTGDRDAILLPPNGQQQLNNIELAVPTSQQQHPNIRSSNVGSTPVTMMKDCPICPSLGDDNAILASLRAKALASSPPHIIECAAAKAGESQSACHLPSETRFAALKQKGATLWMTGCSGAGKTTIATALEDKLVKLYGKHVYRLDGDNLRTTLNRDLGFSEADRAESVRRTGELATLFADAGVITLVGLISPYRADRDAVRQRHVEQGIPFYEVFLDVPVEELKKRDPKGQYARVESGELKHFTCIDDPYEEPLHPEIVLKTHQLALEESVEILFRTLERDGILMGPPKVAPPGLPNPDGDVLIDLHVPDNLKDSRRREAETLPKVLITDIDLNWLQTIGEGWAAPLTGFMREGVLLETLHFNSLLVDPFNLTSNVNRITSATNFDTFPDHQPPTRVSMSIPITLSCTSFTKTNIELSGKDAVAIVTQMGQTVAILRNPEIYSNRKEEIITRMFGAIDPGHPYIKYIQSGGDYLIGGEIELLDRIRYNDGLDKWRKTVTELLDEFKQKGADTVYAFQTRNPTHAGHAYLMRSAGDDLKQKGYKKPVLWLSPLGGWTKQDDVPLDVRVTQHEEVLKAGLSHPGGLDPQSTVMAIWPSPMVYAGPTEVQFHAKSRRNAGASYFVVGRDPAGLKGSMDAVAHPDDDLYDGNHGRYVLQYSPGIGDMQMLSFVKVMYDIKDNTMKIPDETRMNDFISISGSKMRLLARNGATPCSLTNIPTDLVEANCVPAGFMVPNGWNKVVDYYRNIDATERWTPWSKPVVSAPVDRATKQLGVFGSKSFQLSHTQYDSLWHDVHPHPQRTGKSGEEVLIHMVTEIPMYYTAKMEVQKTIKGNPIAQDNNKDGSSRYYTYGTPFFNYGFIPQTWEDPDLKSEQGYGGDNDPLDVIELGSQPLLMGSIQTCRVLGSFELIDEGETDHKIICISLSDPDASSIFSLDDLERKKPNHLNNLRDWLKRYKTSDGKPENNLASDIPRTASQAMSIVLETHNRWKALCGKDGTKFYDTSKTADFWLSSPGCREN